MGGVEVHGSWLDVWTREHFTRDWHDHVMVYYPASEARRFYNNLESTLYLDIWPFGTPVLMVAEKHMICQFTENGELSKYEGILNFLQPLIGALDLVTIEDEHWKLWHCIFNSAFGTASLKSKTPLVMEEVKAFIWADWEAVG